MYWIDNIVGQQKIKTILKKNIETNRVSHAQLFLGPYGRGGLILAMAYAEMLVTKSSTNLNSTFVKCKKIIHPDIHIIFPVNTTTKIKEKPKSSQFIKEFRTQFIKDPYMQLEDWYTQIEIENKQGLINTQQSSEIIKLLSLKPFESEYKVMIIWGVDKMNISSANKLLKIIEEPPKKTIFLLVSDKEEDILPTILSRTQIIRIPPISIIDIGEKIIEKYNLSSDKAKSIAAVSNGDFHQACHYVETKNDADFYLFKNWMRFCFLKNFFDVKKWVMDIKSLGREHQKRILHYGLHIFRECLIFNYADESLLRIENEEKEFVSKFKVFVNSKNVINLVKEFENAFRDIQRNGNGEIIFLNLSIKVMKLLTVK